MRLEFSIYRITRMLMMLRVCRITPWKRKRSRHDVAGCAYPAERERSQPSFRRSCREGVCGSDGLNMNGRMVWPVLPRFRHSTSRARRCDSPAARFTGDPRFGGRHGTFYAQYEKIKPYLLNNGQNPPLASIYRCQSSAKNSTGCMNDSLRMLFNLLSVFLVESR